MSKEQIILQASRNFSFFCYVMNLFSVAYALKWNGSRCVSFLEATNATSSEESISDSSLDNSANGCFVDSSGGGGGGGTGAKGGRGGVGIAIRNGAGIFILFIKCKT